MLWVGGTKTWEPWASLDGCEDAINDFFAGAAVNSGSDEDPEDADTDIEPTSEQELLSVRAGRKINVSASLFEGVGGEALVMVEIKKVGRGKLPKVTLQVRLPTGGVVGHELTRSVPCLQLCTDTTQTALVTKSHAKVLIDEHDKRPREARKSTGTNAPGAEPVLST